MSSFYGFFEVFCQTSLKDNSEIIIVLVILFVNSQWRYNNQPVFPWLFSRWTWVIRFLQEFLERAVEQNLEDKWQRFCGLHVLRITQPRMSRHWGQYKAPTPTSGLALFFHRTPNYDRRGIARSNYSRMPVPSGNVQQLGVWVCSRPVGAFLNCYNHSQPVSQTQVEVRP